ncbi:MAG: eukaryotic-like serine/threonine-protein kinase [Thermoleophilaceae bacterium]|nr:eukaryotic-like serine/threonine-protein kinase [Thermoleophilaceae bacterium]
MQRFSHLGREHDPEAETRHVTPTHTTRPGPDDATRADEGALPGLVLGRYRLVGAIGAGGHGSVWRAFDEKLQRQVAVKAMPRANASGDRRAEREARAAARLNHPGIVAMYELGTDDRAVYLVSELVEGKTLAELEDEGAVSDHDVGQVGLAMCAALAHAHQKGVIHRDVKPQNVLVAADPAAGSGFAKLGDFGVARLVSEEPLTATGGVVGTLAYMAPEQAAGGDVTAAADVYALALTLHEAWSGLHPEGPGRNPRSLRIARRDLPAELAETIDACLSPRPALRPPLKDLAAAIRSAIPDLSDVDGLVEPGTLERLGLTAPLRRRNTDPDIDFALPDEPREPGRLAQGAMRLGAGALTALVVLATSTALAPAPPFQPFIAAAVVFAITTVFPRAGWLVSAFGLCVWLVAAGRPGAALLIALPAALTPALLPRAGVLWSLPALAPLLGLGGVAMAFPAVAGLASTVWRRAGLAAAGVLWLLAGEAIAGSRLLEGPVSGAPDAWLGSPLAAAREAAWPLLASGLLLWTAVWAALAVVLPLALAGRSIVLRTAGAALWTAAAVAAALALGNLLDLPDARGVVAGAALGALGALAWTALRPAPGAFRAPPVP